MISVCAILIGNTRSTHVIYQGEEFLAYSYHYRETRLSPITPVLLRYTPTEHATCLHIRVRLGSILS